MKVRVNDKCIGCGNCISLTNREVFDYNDEGLADCIIDIIPEDKVEITKEAIMYCPTSAIEEINEEK